MIVRLAVSEMASSGPPRGWEIPNIFSLLFVYDYGNGLESGVTVVTKRSRGHRIVKRVSTDNEGCRNIFGEVLSVLR